MSVRTIRLLCGLGSLVMAGFAVAAGTWGLRSPEFEPLAEFRLTEVVQSGEDEEVGETTSLNELLAIGDIAMRRPLYDPPPPPPPKKREPRKPVTPKPKPSRPVVRKPRIPKPPPEPIVRLLGTVIEEGRSMAILSDQAGQIDVKPTGETLELKPNGMVVEAIEDDTVSLRFNGRLLSRRVGESGGKRR